MKRALLVGLGTVAGTAAVLAYQPGTLFGTGNAATAVTATPRSAPLTQEQPAQPQPPQPQPPQQPPAQPVAQTFTGEVVQTVWGPVEVEVSVTDGQLTSVQTLQAPNGDQRSAMISSVAIPRLEQQAMDAQSARIDGVSGASYTSAGFAQSLQSALVQAGLG